MGTYFYSNYTVFEILCHLELNYLPCRICLSIGDRDQKLSIQIQKGESNLKSGPTQRIIKNITMFIKYQQCQFYQNYQCLQLHHCNLDMFTPFLKGKTALVTGSLSGIGLGIAKSLSAAGANVVLNGFASDQQISKIQKEISVNGRKAKFIYADLMKPADNKSLVQKSIAHFGQVDILVNNAGIQHIDSVQKFPEQNWDKIIALNLSSSFHTIKHALPGMKQRKWGRIINIASVHGLVASINKVAYVAAKHGVVGLTKVVALQNAQSGVTCNAICPGFVLTPLIQKQIQLKSQQHKVSLDEAKKILVTEKQPSGNLCSTEDIGNLATYLCSESAKQIQGAAYTVDGGWTAQ